MFQLGTKPDHNDEQLTKSALTALFRREYTVVENFDEPLEGVLVHRVDVLQVGEAEEEYLAPYCHGDVQ